MPAPLRQDRRISDNYGIVHRYPRTVRKVKPVYKKKRKPVFFRFIFTLFVLSLFCYYVAPRAYFNYVEPLFINPILNRCIKNDMSKFVSPTLNYLANTELFGQNLRVQPAAHSKSMIPIITSGELVSTKVQLNNLFSKYPNLKPSVFVWEYSSAKNVMINADSSYPAASIIKLPILFELFRKIDRSQEDKTFATTLDKKLLYNYMNKTDGSGKLQFSRLNKYYSVDHLAKIMITQSDNSATNMLLEEMGGIGAFNSAMRSLGLKEVSIQNRLPDLEGTNRISAREIATLLYNLDNTKYLSNKSKISIKEYMANVENRSLLQAGLPPEAILIHKTGDIGTMLGDAGVVYAQNGRKYIVVVLVKRPFNDYSARDLIQEASRIIYTNINSGIDIN